MGATFFFRESSDGCINQTDDFEVWTDYIDVMQGSPGSSLKRTASEHLAEVSDIMFCSLRLLLASFWRCALLEIS